jgi:hypothetical protein
VLRGAPAEGILGALTGVSLAPADLTAILTGCVVPDPKPASGAQYGNDWRSILLEDGSRLYFRRVNNRWELRAADRSGWRLEYPAWQGGFPRVVRLISRTAPAVDMTAAISQLESNAPIDAAAFDVEVPAGALPITLDELRQAGPLRSASTSR